MTGGRTREPGRLLRLEELPAGFATWRPTATTSAGSAAAAAKAAAATAAALRLGTRLVDIERTAVEFVTVERGDRTIGFRRIRHFDEGETTRPAGITVGYYVDTFHIPVGLEERTDG
jgi:hypothetical protein